MIVNHSKTAEDRRRELITTDQADSATSEEIAHAMEATHEYSDAMVDANALEAIYEPNAIMLMLMEFVKDNDKI